MGNLASAKTRIFTGELVTSETYNKFNGSQRVFWGKALKCFLRGDFYFMYKKLQYVVPFRLQDDSFNSIDVVEKLKEKVSKIKSEKDVTNVGSDASGQGEPVDTLATNA